MIYNITKWVMKMEKNKRKTYRRHKNYLIMFNTLTSIILAICILFSGFLGVMAYLTHDMRQNTLSDDHEELGINSDAVKDLPKDIINIALFGVDTREKKVTDRNKLLAGNSDTIIIVSINTNDNTIKLTSILRDSWVPVNGKYNKINSAYAGGGAQRAIHTLNSNFGLNIKDYVAVSLQQMKNVLDVLGGIDIEITEKERKWINKIANDPDDGFSGGYLDKSGLVHLNGTQALSYSRIRYDSEETRVLRQQKVLSCLFEKAKQLPAEKYPSVLKQVLSFVETSMTYDEILSFAPMLAISGIHLQKTSIPGKEVVASGGIFEDTRGGWVWKYDIEEAKRYIYYWVYNIK